MKLLCELLKQLGKAFGYIIFAGIGVCLVADSIYKFVTMDEN